jgi:DNA gyrase subunit A
MSLDPRAAGAIAPRKAAAVPPVHAIAVTSDGYALRFSLEGFVEPSTRAGRRYARIADGAEVVAVSRTTGDETIIVATADARALLCKADEVNFLSGPGRGVILIKVKFPDDKVIGAIVSSGDRDLMTVETSRGAEQTISTAKYEITGRGGKGRELLQRGQFVRVLPAEVSVPAIAESGN